MIIAEFSIVPITGNALSPCIDSMLEIVKNSGMNFELDAMGATLEGDIDQILDVVKTAHAAVKLKGADRILTEIRIDDRAQHLSIADEVDSYRGSL